MKRPLPAARDEWFDRLARGTAKRISRRDAVGFFAGTTAMAILGTWMKPGRAFAATPRAAPDPGCAGTRTFYRTGCAKPVPKLDAKYPVNGCGPQNGFNPVPQTPLNLANFSPACDEHDIGYGTCNRPKEVTDKKFLEDMKAICVKTYPATGLFTSMLLVQCARNAEIYYTAVSSALGLGPYADGQSNGCDCCEECPGGAAKCGGECCRKGLVCGDKGKCCAPCQPGWIKCPYPNEPRCGYGCCMPGAPICCPGMQPGSLRCCNGKCFRGGCG